MPFRKGAMSFKAKGRPRGRGMKLVTKRDLERAKELKFFDINMMTTSGSGIETYAAGLTAGYRSLQLPALCVPTQGTGASNRIGRKLTLKSIDIRGHIQASIAGAGNNASGGYIRMVVYVDKTPNGQTGTKAVTAKSTYDGTNTAGIPDWASGTDPVLASDLYVTSDPDAPRNLSNTGRYYVLKEKVIRYGFTDTDSLTQTPFHLNINRSIEMSFASGTGTSIPDDIISNNVGVLIMTTQKNTTDAQGPLIQFHSRCRYTDE